MRITSFLCLLALLIITVGVSTETEECAEEEKRITRTILESIKDYHQLFTLNRIIDFLKDVFDFSSYSTFTFETAVIFFWLGVGAGVGVRIKEKSSSKNIKQESGVTKGKLESQDVKNSRATQ